MANEIVLVDKWLYGVLSADSMLAGLVSTRIYSYLTPTGAGFPSIVYAYQGSMDVVAVGGIRIMNSGMYLVKAITQDNSMVGAAKSIADRIDALLHGQQFGVVTGGIVLACVREYPIAYVEYLNGLRYNHCGGIFRVIAQGA